MKRFLILPLIISIIFASSCIKSTSKQVNAKPKEITTVLLIGLDDAAQNMDVLCFASYHTTKNEITFAQIPRDTYYNFGGTQNKINQLYAHYRMSEDHHNAMGHAASEISRELGVSTDGYIAITTNGLIRGIDALGGIDIELSGEYTFTDENGNNPITLNNGINHLNGADCVQFIRFRKGYATGDLGRLDAQKLFFRGVLSEFAKHPSVDKIIRAYGKVNDEIVTDLKISDLLRLSTVGLQSLPDAKVNYITMPGESTTSQRGISYYVLNRKGARQVIENYLYSAADDFDRNARFLCNDEISFQNIYNDPNVDYRVYSNDTLDRISIPKKQ